MGCEKQIGVVPNDAFKWAVLIFSSGEILSAGLFILFILWKHRRKAYADDSLLTLLLFGPMTVSHGLKNILNVTYCWNAPSNFPDDPIRAMIYSVLLCAIVWIIFLFEICSKKQGLIDLISELKDTVELIRAQEPAKPSKNEVGESSTLHLEQQSEKVAGTRSLVANFEQFNSQMTELSQLQTSI